MVEWHEYFLCIWVCKPDCRLCTLTIYQDGGSNSTLLRFRLV